MSLLPPFLSLFAIFCLLPFLPFCDLFPSLFGHSSSSAADPPLMCYRGIKYFIGQEEIDDNIRCELNMLERAMPGMEKYCYKFVSHTGVTDFVKRGCSVVICSGLRNVCAKLEFEGVQGEMCCCSESSYCNASEGPALRPLFVLLAFSFALFSSPPPRFLNLGKFQEYSRPKALSVEQRSSLRSLRLLK
ncbi:hypothetical protein niasHT_013536 [Heterodera trifolii]|uniref:Protein quiver n=1 Tax=Heterodera trifolii TaxID=157864 RepID=A0ABD2LD00_9BILA